MTDFDFDAAAADLGVSTYERLMSVIESAGKTVVHQGDMLLAVNEDQEVSFAAHIVEHNGEYSLIIPRTKWFGKFSTWLAASPEFENLNVYTERTADDTDFRVYVS